MCPFLSQSLNLEGREQLVGWPRLYSHSHNSRAVRLKTALRGETAPQRKHDAGPELGKVSTFSFILFIHSQPGPQPQPRPWPSGVGWEWEWVAPGEAPYIAEPCGKVTWTLGPMSSPLSEGDIGS